MLLQLVFEFHFLISISFLVKLSFCVVPQPTDPNKPLLTLHFQDVDGIRWSGKSKRDTDVHHPRRSEKRRTSRILPRHHFHHRPRRSRILLFLRGLRDDKTPPRPPAAPRGERGAGGDRNGTDYNCRGCGRFEHLGGVLPRRRGQIADAGLLCGWQIGGRDGGGGHADERRGRPGVLPGDRTHLVSLVPGQRCAVSGVRVLEGLYDVLGYLMIMLGNCFCFTFV